MQLNKEKSAIIKLSKRQKLTKKEQKENNIDGIPYTNNYKYLGI